MSDFSNPPIVPPPSPAGFPERPTYQAQTSKLAVAALVCALLSMTCVLLPLGLVAIVCGIIAILKINEAKGALKGKGMAIAGLVMGSFAFILIPSVVVMFPALSRARMVAQRASCQNNLKQMGIVFKMYSGENKDLYPSLSPIYGHMMCDVVVYPDFLSAPHVLACPSDPDPGDRSEDPKQRLSDASYYYFGYCVMNDAEMKTLADAYRNASATGATFDNDLQVQPGTGNNGSDNLYHLRDGVERLLASNPDNAAEVQMKASEIPVMMDRPNNHVPRGGNVLFLDGHVEFIRYPGEFPMTEATIKAFEDLTSSTSQ